MSGINQVKIAIVEDDAYFNKILTKTTKDITQLDRFSELRCTLKSYLSGRDFVESLDEDTDILILDHYLDYHDTFPYNGFDVMRVIGNECKNCKIIVVSGQRNPAVIEKLQNKGIHAYLDKEGNVTKKLSEKITGLLETYRNQTHTL